MAYGIACCYIARVRHRRVIQAIVPAAGLAWGASCLIGDERRTSVCSISQMRVQNGILYLQTARSFGPMKVPQFAQCSSSGCRIGYSLVSENTTGTWCLNHILIFVDQARIELASGKSLETHLHRIGSLWICQSLRGL